MTRLRAKWKNVVRGYRQSFGTPTITIHVQGSIIGSDPDHLAVSLTKIILPQLKAIEARTTGPLLGGRH